MTAVAIGATSDAYFATAVERWYNDTMDRLSGLYKRRTQAWLWARWAHLQGSAA